MIGDLLSEKHVAVVAGSGGVGKTTVAASIALQAALETERRVLVITVDPARRLADALGLGALDDAPTRVPDEAFQASGLAPKGSLDAAMLDTKKAWDALVRRHSPDDRTAQSILANPLYKNIAGRFVQSHDYIAMERLYELHAGGEYDLIVVDTPPSGHAVDLLDAPQRLADFFDSRLLKFLVAPSKSRLAMLTAKPFMQLADRLLGRRFLEDISQFFTLLESMRPGFIERANKVDALLRSDETTFLVVTTLEPAASHEAERFVDEVHSRKIELGAIITNRVLPFDLAGPDVAVAASALAARAAELGDLLEPQLGNPAKTGRVFTELAANADRLGVLAGYEKNLSEELAGRAKILASIPWFEHELRDLSSLAKLGQQVW